MPKKAQVKKLGALIIGGIIVLLIILWMIRGGNPLTTAKNTIKALFGFTDESPEQRLANFKADLSSCYASYKKNTEKTDCGTYKVKGPFDESELSSDEFSVVLQGVDWNSNDATGKVCVKGTVVSGNTIFLVNC